jgi:outer membrane receptor protein involved in Fe transport
LSDENIANGTLELTETTQFGLTQSDWYNGYQTIYGGFISTQWHLIEDLSFSIGGRIEQSIQTIEVPMSLNGEYVEVSRVQNIDFLPALNVTYALTDNTNLRAAYSRTLARPEFREISNFNFADFLGGQRVYGNPDLKQTNIINYDLRLETYPGGGELFAISAFYKHFENPIELFYRLTDANEVFYDNAPEADLYGIEIEGRKNVTERLQLVANASYIFSESRMGEDAANRVANVKRPMVGQSPYIINASAFYVIPEWNVDLSLSYNTFGKRIVTVGKNGQQYDEYEQPFHNLGAKIDYSIGGTDLSLEINNLLYDVHEYKLGPATTYKYKPGMTFKFGITVSL